MKGSRVKREAETGVMQPQAKDAWSRRELEEARKDPPRSSERLWPCQHLAFGLLASRL